MNARKVLDIEYQLMPGADRKTTDIVIERNGIIAVRPPSNYTPDVFLRDLVDAIDVVEQLAPVAEARLIGREANRDALVALQTANETGQQSILAYIRTMSSKKVSPPASTPTAGISALATKSDLESLRKALDDTTAKLSSRKPAPVGSATSNAKYSITDCQY